MKEVEPDSHWVDAINERDVEVTEHMQRQFAELMQVPSAPNDAELISITLLARLYDVGMAILTVLDEQTAGKVYEAHSQGENFNPEMFIPDLKVGDE